MEGRSTLPQFCENVAFAVAWTLARAATSLGRTARDAESQNVLSHANRLGRSNVSLEAPYKIGGMP
jgi:hypothetical protein